MAMCRPATVAIGRLTARRLLLLLLLVVVVLRQAPPAGAAPGGGGRAAPRLRPAAGGGDSGGWRDGGAEAQAAPSPQGLDAQPGEGSGTSPFPAPGRNFTGFPEFAARPCLLSSPSRVCSRRSLKAGVPVTTEVALLAGW